MVRKSKLLVLMIGLMIAVNVYFIYYGNVNNSSANEHETTRAPYKWTVIVYLDGDNSLGSTYSSADLAEIQSVTPPVGVATIVFYDDPATGGGDSALYVGADGNSVSQVTTGLPSWWPADNELDMGDVNTLINCIEWAMTNYPAEHYWLDLWDHGGSLYGCCWDDTSSTNIDLKDLVDALWQVHNDTGDWIDVISHDECLMAENGVNYNQMLFTNYTVSSEDSIGGDGFEYQNVLPHIYDNVSAGGDISPEDFALAICYEYYAYYGTSGSYTTLSAINNTLYEYYMVEALNAFGQKLMHKAGTLNTQITTARDNAATWQATAGYDFDRDMVDFCYQIQSQIPATTDAEIYNSASRLINISDPDADGAGVIMMHNQNLGEYGIKAYVENGASYRTDYDKSFIAKETNWDDFVKAMLASTDYPDEEPIIEMLSPVNGTKIYTIADINNINSTTVYGVVNISGTASDPDGTVQRIEICIDREWWNTTAVTLLPDGTWYYNWDTSKVSEGWHHIMVRAYDGQDWSEYYEHAWLYVVHNTPPTVDISAPLQGAIVSGTYNIQWNATDLEDGTALSIDIYYSTDNATWIPIVSGTSNTGSYPWDSTTVSDGQYYIKVVATDSQGAQGYDITGPFWVDNVASPPVVSIIAPEPYAVIMPGSVYEIRYSAYDNDPTGSIVGVDIYVSYDGGVSWTAIATGLANTGSYNWSVPEGYGDSIYIKVVATDNDGMSGNDSSGPLKLAAKLYFQVQQSAVVGYENLSFEPLESVQNEKVVNVPDVGETRIGAWLTAPLSKDYNLKGVWNFSVYGKAVGTVGGYFEAKVYDYNGGTPVLLFTAQDDENISLYTEYHEFAWSYDYSGYIVPAGGRVLVEIYMNATYAVSVNESEISNPTFDADSTGWSSAITGSGTTAAFDSATGNPAGAIYADVAGSWTVGYEGTVYWNTTFYYGGPVPDSVTLSFDRYVSAYSAYTTNQYTIYLKAPDGTVYTIYPTTAYTAVDTAWVSVKNYAVNASYLSVPGNYTLSIYVEISSARRASTRVYFDNIYLNVTAKSQVAMGYDYSGTPSYVVMPQVKSHKIYGYVYYSDGVTPASGATVNITDNRTGALISVVANATGYYEYDISWLGYIGGDEIYVTAYDSATGGKGSGATVVDDTVSGQQVDITLSAAPVPELSVYMLLVVFIVLILLRRR